LNFESDVIEENLDGIEGDALDTQKAVDAVEADDSGVNDKEKKRLVADESQGSGAVALSTYTLYWKAMGQLPFWVVLLTAMIMSQVLQVSTNAWVKDWANSSAGGVERARMYLSDTLRSLGSGGHSTQWYLAIYAGLSGAYLFSIAARVGVLYFGSIRASKRLYDRLLRRILGAKMR
jgi:hypothetical protein